VAKKKSKKKKAGFQKAPKLNGDPTARCGQQAPPAADTKCGERGGDSRLGRLAKLQHTTPPEPPATPNKK